MRASVTYGGKTGSVTWDEEEQEVRVRGLGTARDAVVAWFAATTRERLPGVRLGSVFVVEQRGTSSAREFVRRLVQLPTRVRGLAVDFDAFREEARG